MVHPTISASSACIKVYLVCQCKSIFSSGPNPGTRKSALAKTFSRPFRTPSGSLAQALEVQAAPRAPAAAALPAPSLAAAPAARRAREALEPRHRRAAACPSTPTLYTVYNSAVLSH